MNINKKKYFTIPNLISIVIIVIGILCSFGVAGNILPMENILPVLIALIALQFFFDRITILFEINEKVSDKQNCYSIQLMPRNVNYTDLSSFISNAKEVVFIGIDLGYLASAQSHLIKESLRKGMSFKFLIVDPNASGYYKEIVNNHDERNSFGKEPIHEHFKCAAETLTMLENIWKEEKNGSIEIRSRIDIPNPTMTMTDPSERLGQIRIDLKPYKKNHGNVPFFTLTSSDMWYSMFYEHYYAKLWDDSPVLYSSNKTKQHRKVRHS